MREEVMKIISKKLDSSNIELNISNLAFMKSSSFMNYMYTYYLSSHKNNNFFRLCDMKEDCTTGFHYLHCTLRLLGFKAFTNTSPISLQLVGRIEAKKSFIYINWTEGEKGNLDDMIMRILDVKNVKGTIY